MFDHRGKRFVRGSTNNRRSRVLTIGVALCVEIAADAGDVVVEGSACSEEIGAVVAEVVAELGGPSGCVPVEPGPPSFEEPLRL